MTLPSRFVGFLFLFHTFVVGNTTGKNNCSHWVIRNCGNLSIRCTARSWDSAATTKPEHRHPSCAASALLPAKRRHYPKSIKSSRPFLCSNSVHLVHHFIRPRRPTTTTVATPSILSITTLSAIAIIIIDVIRLVLTLTLSLHVCPSGFRLSVIFAFGTFAVHGNSWLYKIVFLAARWFQKVVFLAARWLECMEWGRIDL